MNVEETRAAFRKGNQAANSAIESATTLDEAIVTALGEGRYTVDGGKHPDAATGVSLLDQAHKQIAQIRTRLNAAIRETDAYLKVLG